MSLFEKPLHPYTEGIFASIPRLPVVASQKGSPDDFPITGTRRPVADSNRGARMRSSLAR